jgi:hypothetical protein
MSRLVDNRIFSKDHYKFTSANNTKQWFKNGVLHRDNDKPAFICEVNYGAEKSCWYIDGKLHRDNNKPAIVLCENNVITVKEWYINGECYKKFNDEGQFVKIECLQNEQLHNTDGPAVIKTFYDLKYSGDEKVVKEWWVKGIRLNDRNKFELTELNLPSDILGIIEKFKPIEQYIPKSVINGSLCEKIWFYNRKVVQIEEYDKGPYYSDSDSDKEYEPPYYSEDSN